jgi:anti-sigma B factor antagonist
MSNENLQVHSSEGLRGAKVLELHGSLTIRNVFTFQDAVRDHPAQKMVIDFSGVPFIDSAGLGALVGFYISSQKSMRKLAFSGLNTQVKALMDMTSVSQLFKSYPSVREAEAALG